MAAVPIFKRHGRHSVQVLILLAMYLVRLTGLLLGYISYNE